jgi:hypothetical protein
VLSSLIEVPGAKCEYQAAKLEKIRESLFLLSAGGNKCNTVINGNASWTITFKRCRNCLPVLSARDIIHLKVAQVSNGLFVNR